MQIHTHANKFIEKNAVKLLLADLKQDYEQYDS